MKKWLVALLGVLFFAPAVFADNWGLGLKLGVGENDPETLKELQDRSMVNTELDQNSGIFGVEALYEWTLNDESNKLGVKLGWTGFGENELEMSYAGSWAKFTENTFAVPLTVYYKRDNGVKAWSPFAGVGISYFRSQFKFEESTGAEEKEHKSKVVPHLVAGAEYRFSKWFALGVEAQYTFNAKIEKNEAVYSDRTGLSGAITGRFYF